MNMWPAKYWTEKFFTDKQFFGTFGVPVFTASTKKATSGRSGTPPTAVVGKAQNTAKIGKRSYASTPA